MNKKIELNRPNFYQQFPNLDKHHDSSNYSRKEWYEWDEPEAREGRATGGSVDAEGVEMVPLSDHFK